MNISNLLFYIEDKSQTTAIEQIEKELIYAGFAKVDPVIRRQAAQLVIAQTETSLPNLEKYDDDVKTLFAYYREMKIKEFLQNKYARLSSEKKLELLKYILEESEFKISNANLGKVFTSTGNLAVSTLAIAYKDADLKIKAYAKSILENVFKTSSSSLITPQNVDVFIDEYVQLQSIPQPYQILEEPLKETSTILKSFMYDVSGNVYVFSYPKHNKIMHTVIDTGSRKYMPYLLKMFSNNGVDPANIETILLTHHHIDHSGLIDIVCLASGATALMHHDFQEDNIETDGSGYIGRDSADSMTSQNDRELVLPKFSKYIKRLPPINDCPTRNIGGIAFPRLSTSLEIGEDARLEILGLPLSGNLTHAIDQLFFLYTPKNSPETFLRIGSSFRPTDEIIFSGDLWLMHSPGFPDKMMDAYKIHELIKERKRKVDFRPENRKEKNALKMGFNLVRVKPGHGPEFLGSKMINHLLSNRDIRVRLGFDEDDKQANLADARWVLPVSQLREQTYQSFIDELLLWLGPFEKGGFGYNIDQASNLLRQIYQEQAGGGELVGQDRQERRLDIKNKLARLMNDVKQNESLRSFAHGTLALIEKG